MAGLAETTARLLRQQQRWRRTLNQAGSDARPASGADRLTEMQGFGSNPGNLRMLTYAPVNLRPSAPLVVVLHGCTQSAAGYDAGVGWSTLADELGFALLLPEQRRTNNPNNCFTWFQTRDVNRDCGEALSIRQMVEHAAIAYQSDPARIYVTGLSAGGAMANVMLAAYPEVFAGGAIIAGLPYLCATRAEEAFECMLQGQRRSASAWGDLVRRASSHRGRWPRISIWHGAADEVVKPVNASETLKQWLDVHGLAARDGIVEPIGAHRRQTWYGLGGEPLVEAFSIQGMGHGAPVDMHGPGRRYGAAGPYILDAGISSTERIARFWNLTSPPLHASDDLTATTPRQPESTPPPPGPEASMRDPGAGRAGPFRQAGAPEKETRAGEFSIESTIVRALRSAGLME